MSALPATSDWWLAAAKAAGACHATGGMANHAQPSSSEAAAAASSSSLSEKPADGATCQDSVARLKDRVSVRPGDRSDQDLALGVIGDRPLPRDQVEQQCRGRRCVGEVRDHCAILLEHTFECKTKSRPRGEVSDSWVYGLIRSDWTA